MTNCFLTKKKRWEYSRKSGLYTHWCRRRLVSRQNGNKGDYKHQWLWLHENNELRIDNTTISCWQEVSIEWHERARWKIPVWNEKPREVLCSKADSGIFPCIFDEILMQQVFSSIILDRKLHIKYFDVVFWVENIINTKKWWNDEKFLATQNLSFLCMTVHMTSQIGSQRGQRRFVAAGGGVVVMPASILCLKLRYIIYEK